MFCTCRSSTNDNTIAVLGAEAQPWSEGKYYLSY